jgi:hypothetical protein
MHEIMLQLSDAAQINPPVWKLGVSKLGIDTILGGNGTAFNPVSLPNCTMYLRSDTGVQTSGANVLTWGDLSGHGRDATSSAIKPTLVPGVQANKPAIRIALNTFMTYASSALGLNWTAFAVLSIADVANGLYTLSEEGVGTQTVNIGANFYHAGDNDGTNSANPQLTFTPAANTPYILYATSAQGQPTSVYLNNSAATSASAAAPLTLQSPTTMTLCGPGGLNRTQSGDLFAIVAYNRVLSSTELGYVLNGLNTLFLVY